MTRGIQLYAALRQLRPRVPPLLWRPRTCLPAWGSYSAYREMARAGDINTLPVEPSAYLKRCRIGGAEGGSSSVWLGSISASALEVALKLVDLEQSSLERLQAEVQAVSQIAHPNLVPLLSTFVNREELWLVMPLYASGSCADIMQWAHPDGFEETATLVVLREVGRGLAYLHDHGTLHRHLKSSNILINADGGVGIADFGLSSRLYDGGERRSRAGTFVGSFAWMAPEMLEQVNGYDASVDVWSLGITAIELSSGAVPHAGLHPLQVCGRPCPPEPSGLHLPCQSPKSQGAGPSHRSCCASWSTSRQSHLADQLGFVKWSLRACSVCQRSVHQFTHCSACVCSRISHQQPPMSTFCRSSPSCRRCTSGTPL